MKQMPITKTGYEKLKKELEQLRTVSLPENIRDIEVARGHGDLSENAEFISAKERQTYLQARIKELEKNISMSVVTEIRPSPDGRIVFGSSVAIEDSKTGQEITYLLVGPFESNIHENKISVTSPIGKALIGRKIGEEIKVTTPGGLREFEIVDVFFNENPQ